MIENKIHSKRYAGEMKEHHKNHHQIFFFSSPSSLLLCRQNTCGLCGGSSGVLNNKEGRHATKLKIDKDFFFINFWCYSFLITPSLTKKLHWLIEKKTLMSV